MIRHMRKRTCKHCKTFFDPDPRNVGRQHYCAKPLCRQASKAASQRRWLRKPENQDYFRGPAHVERVRQWRQHQPGYGRRKASQASDAPEVLQDSLTPQSSAISISSAIKPVPSISFWSPWRMPRDSVTTPNRPCASACP